MSKPFTLELDIEELRLLADWATLHLFNCGEFATQTERDMCSQLNEAYANMMATASWNDENPALSDSEICKTHDIYVLERRDADGQLL